MKKNASFLTTLLIGVATIGLSQTKAATEAKVDSLLPSNQTKQITASRLREAIKSVVEYATPSNIPSGSITLNKLNGQGASVGQVPSWNGTSWVPSSIGSDSISISRLSVGAHTQASAILEVTSTTKGFLPPRMSAAERDAIFSPATGLVIYCTNESVSSGGGSYQFYDGIKWTNLNPKKSFAASNVPESTGTLSDVPNCTFNAKAGRRYVVNIMISFKTDTQAGGVQFAINSSDLTSSIIGRASLLVGSVYNQILNTIPVITSLSSVSVANTNYYCTIEATIFCAIDSTVKLQFASKTNGALATINNVNMTVEEYN